MCEEDSGLNSKQYRTLKSIFDKPERSDIRWPDVESLIEATGGVIKQGSGSRKRATLNGVRVSLHKPHPRPEMDKGAVKDLRRFFEEAGLTP